MSARTRQRCRSSGMCDDFVRRDDDFVDDNVELAILRRFRSIDYRNSGIGVALLTLATFLTGRTVEMECRFV